MADQDATSDQTPAAPRIGDGALSITAGLVLAALAVFASFAAAGGGGADAGGAMAVCATLAVFLIGLGFFKRMFHMLERRLIDIQTHGPRG